MRRAARFLAPILALFSSALLPTGAQSGQAPFFERLVAAALERTRHEVTYDGTYRRIPYPGGDVPSDVGVCTDLIIRSYRAVGIDLQRAVHEDMSADFGAYPQLWGLSGPDTNIDHRRVPNLRAFFAREGASLPVSNDPADYRPGDLVTWMLPGNLPHIGIVTDRRAPSGRWFIVHNIGAGPVAEDVLFSYELTGHYRYPALETPSSAGAPAVSERIRVAVATNFKAPAEEIAALFEASAGHRVTLVFGSTGKHYAQIRNGAPFDALLAADVARPRRLEADGLAVADSRFTYALGRLALWSRDPDLVDDATRVLHEGAVRRLAIANPRLAPYGESAQQVLVSLGLLERYRGRIVLGENIGQTYQFVHSGAADLGLVAYAQIRDPHRAPIGSHALIPEELHDPIRQQAVLLTDSDAARDFLVFLRAPAARAVIERFGYAVP